MKKDISKICVGEIGSVDVGIPLLTIGSGRPRVLLLSGIHGNEFSGLLVIQKLLNKIELKKGTLTIISSANPLAQALGLRETPTDFADLNRVFPGDQGKEGLTERLATAVFAEAKKHDLVIDLHTFSDPCPVIAIFMNRGSGAVKKKSLDFIRSFGPDIVWKLQPMTKRESHFVGALGPKLAEEGIVNFAVEMPELFRINNKQLAKIVDGLVNVLSLFGVTESKRKRPQRAIPILERRKFVSDRAGLFIPRKRLMKEVREGEKVGELVSIKTFELSGVVSPFSGTLIILKDASLVNTGDTLFSIGIKKGEV